MNPTNTEFLLKTHCSCKTSGILKLQAHNVVKMGYFRCSNTTCTVIDYFIPTIYGIWKSYGKLYGNHKPHKYTLPQVISLLLQIQVLDSSDSCPTNSFVLNLKGESTHCILIPQTGIPNENNLYWTVKSSRVILNSAPKLK